MRYWERAAGSAEAAGAGRLPHLRGQCKGFVHPIRTQLEFSDGRSLRDLWGQTRTRSPLSCTQVCTRSGPGDARPTGPVALSTSTRTRPWRSAACRRAWRVAWRRLLLPGASRARASPLYVTHPRLLQWRLGRPPAPQPPAGGAPASHIGSKPKLSALLTCVYLEAPHKYAASNQRSTARACCRPSRIEMLEAEKREAGLRAEVEAAKIIELAQYMQVHQCLHSLGHSEQTAGSPRSEGCESGDGQAAAGGEAGTHAHANHASLKTLDLSSNLRRETASLTRGYSRRSRRLRSFTALSDPARSCTHEKLAALCACSKAFHRSKPLAKCCSRGSISSAKCTSPAAGYKHRCSMDGCRSPTISNSTSSR